MNNNWKKLKGLPEFDSKLHSDGCSGGMSALYAFVQGLFPDIFTDEELPWRICCELHDKAYYYGGSMNEKATADEALRFCVAEMIYNDIGNVLGTVMEIAVMIGGLPCFDTPYRWGYGVDFREKRV